MKKLLIAAGLLGGGYLLYKHFASGTVPAASAPSTTGSTALSLTPPRPTFYQENLSASPALPAGLPSDAVLLWGPLTYQANGQILSLYQSPTAGFFKVTGGGGVIPITQATALALTRALGA